MQHVIPEVAFGRAPTPSMAWASQSARLTVSEGSVGRPVASTSSRVWSTSPDVSYIGSSFRNATACTIVTAALQSILVILMGKQAALKVCNNSCCNISRSSRGPAQLPAGLHRPCAQPQGGHAHHEL